MSEYAGKFPKGHWSFLGPGCEDKWFSTRTHEPDSECDRVADIMMLSFGESGNPVFRASSALSRRTVKRKGGGQLSIHYCGDSEIAELIFRTIVSVSQLSIYGAVSDWCEELAKRISICSEQSAGKPASKNNSEPTMALAAVSTATNPLVTDSPEQGNLFRRYRKKFAKLPDDIQIVKTCSDAGFMKTVCVRNCRVCGVMITITVGTCVAVWFMRK